MALAETRFQFRRAVVAALMLTIAANVGVAGDYLGPDLLPDNSTGLIQIRVDALRNSHAESVVWRLIDKVDEELAAFSVRHLGIDTTQLNEVTLLVPPVEMLQDAKEPPFIAAFSFENNFSRDDVLRSLPRGWQSANLGKSRYFRNPNGQFAITFVGSRTIVVGAPEIVENWIQAPRGHQGRDLISRFRGHLQQSHVFGAFDAGQIPQEFLGMLPPDLASLQHAEAVGFSISAQGQLLDVGLHLAFDSNRNAGSARRSLQSLINQGGAALTFVEAEMSRQLENPSVPWSDGVGALGTLAVIRYGQEKLGALKIEQEDRSLEANTQIDTGMLFFAAAAVGSVQQSSAQAQFQDIADELNAAEAAAIQGFE